MFQKTQGKFSDIDKETIDTSTDKDESPAHAEEDAPDTSSAVASLEEENAQLKAQILRLHADMENMRRRASEDRLKLLSDGTKVLAEKFLPAIDTLDLALSSIPQEIAEHPWAEGIKQFDKLMRAALESSGIHKMEITPHTTEFTPELHEALGQTAATEESPSGTITQVYQTGYTFKSFDKVTTLRPAKVQVAL